MTVYELSRDQLDELKNNWFWDRIDYGGISEYLGGDPDPIDKDPDPTDYGYPENIPDEIIYLRYADIDFVNDDFWCTANI